jgi:ABC-2 type transport system permease protein
MRNIWTIAKRELNIYFASPIAYAVAFLVLTSLGGLFIAYILFMSGNTGMGGVPGFWDVTGGLLSSLLVFFIPFLTMRLIADEVRMGTMELLLTAPLRDYELVIGKWLGAFLFVLVLLVISMIFPLILNQLVTPGIDQMLMLSGYLALILMSAAYISLGVAISAIFNNQFAAAIVTLFVVLVFWWLIGIPSYVLTTGGDIFRYLSIGTQINENFAVGKIELSGIIYLLSVTAFGMIIGTTAVEMRRWR